MKRSKTLILAAASFGLAGCTATSRTCPMPEGAPAPDEVSMIEVQGEGEDYWSRWRGPSGQGLVEGTGYPDRWSVDENVLWKVEVPGDGNSSPIVWADRIFLTTAYEDGTRRSVLAYRRSDGKFLWETFAPQAPSGEYFKDGSAASTVAADGRLVYAYLGNQRLMAVDMEGRQVWHAAIGNVRSDGAAGSLLLYKDKLILSQDMSDTGSAFVAAFEKSSGKEVWRAARPGSMSWGTPVAIRAGNRDEIIVSSAKTVFSYDPDTGEELWSCQGNKVEAIPTPVVGLGLVFCSSDGPTLAIRPGGSGDVTETRLEWKAAKGSPHVPSPILYGDYLYMVNDTVSVATCYRAATGEVMWQSRLGEPAREGFSSSPVAVDGKIFFANGDGRTFVLEAGPEFKLLRVNDLQERTLASPALVDGKWYWRTQRHLVAIGE